MKKVEFQEIGNHKFDPESNRITITIKRDFKDALINLDHFSHCVVFTKENHGFNCYLARIVNIQGRTGEMLIESDDNRLVGELVDIKPYFPCEEKADGYDKGIVLREKDLEPLLFKGKPIGKFLSAHNGGVIQFQESENASADAITKSIKQIKEGAFLRVIWWFDRFDNKRYRSHSMCNPPYDNAPRCGVFATRSPVRPNPLASTIVKVKSIDPYNRSISVLGFDGFAHSMILQIVPYQEIDICGAKVPEWVGHWTDRKVFHDIPDIETFVDNNAAFDGSSYYFEELDRNEIFEQEDTDSNEIVVEGASIHNLKNITIRIPKEKITVITGVSGSGKSSLAFDTIYHESQKQFMDLIAPNAFMGTDLKDSMVKKITGLQPSIAIEQKSLGMNPRSTVASVTRVGEYLRLLFATIGERVCPNCNEIVPGNNVCNTCGTIFFTLTPAVFNYNHPEYMCPVCKGLGEELQVDVDLIVTNPELSIMDGASPWWGNLRKHREKPNANWMKGEVLALAIDMNEDLEVPFKDLSEEYKKQIFYGSNGRPVTLNYENTNGRSGTITRPVEGVINILQRLLVENSTSKSMEHIDRFIVNKKCSRCKGERLLEEGRLVSIDSTRYPEAAKMNITVLRKWCHSTYGNLDENSREKCRDILKKIIAKLKKLEQVGLGYINLDRSIPSLSGGEAQRLKIANQFGSGLSNILYIMDEPSRGLHPKDFLFLIEAIQNLKKLKNTVVVVEHKKELIQMADYLIEIGPGAGQYGGQLLSADMVEQNRIHEIEDYEYSVRSADIEENKKIVLKGARANNLKNIEVSIPLNKFVCVIGVSGSGKSSLISKTLFPAIVKALGKSVDTGGEYDSISGVECISDVYYVSQKAIGKNSRSTPGTYTGAFDLIRDYYSKLSEAKKTKLTKEHFSFNSPKGQCEACKGAGEIAIPMHFMPDIYVPCDKCKGKRYIESVLKIKHKGYSISDLLDLEIREVKEIFKNESSIYQILDMLCKVGLSYIKFGQSAATLSGGEAQRIKLAKELCDSKADGTIYILDEPTSGLHDADVDKLSFIIRELTSKGATVVVIEHNPRIIRKADYIIELGPEGGEKGGYLLKEGWC
ncbi:excinuclease ABC A subunit [Anaerotaenia torta]|uniref:TrmO family methyltransferase domain-containing protein n=1 Tax=Anaerotaenia torta TaxID=433293 RepID=UPI003D1AE5AA